MPKCILEQSIKIKDYLSKINKPVKINSIASKYSIVFLIFKFVTNFLKPLPNKAQTHIDGKHITAAVIVTNATPIKTDHNKAPHQLLMNELTIKQK